MRRWVALIASTVILTGCAKRLSGWGGERQEWVQVVPRTIAGDADSTVAFPASIRALVAMGATIQFQDQQALAIVTAPRRTIWWGGRRGTSMVHPNSYGGPALVTHHGGHGGWSRHVRLALLIQGSFIQIEPRAELCEGGGCNAVGTLRWDENEWVDSWVARFQRELAASIQQVREPSVPPTAPSEPASAAPPPPPPSQAQ